MCVLALCSWAKSRCLSLRIAKSADSTVAHYFEVIFFAGFNVYHARHTLWGVGFERDLGVSAAAFSKTHRSLKGWKTATPETPEGRFHGRRFWQFGRPAFVLALPFVLYFSSTPMPGQASWSVPS